MTGADDDVRALERRLELVANELRDLNRWLREDQAKQLKKIEDALELTRLEYADLDRRHGKLTETVERHESRIAALETAAGKKRRK